MKKLTVIFSIIIILSMLLAGKSKAQTLKGRIWQSQDSTSTTFKPKTIVINSDGTFYQVGYFYVNPSTIYPIETESFEGKYNLIKDEITLTSFLNGKPAREWFYKINWVNSKEFILIDGNKRYPYAELGSSQDKFFKRLIIPYLKKTISKNETYDPCYKAIITSLGVDTVKLREEYKIRNEAFLKKKESEKFYSTFHDKTFIYRSDGRITTYSFGSDGSFKYRDEVNNDGCVDSFEARGSYTSNKSSIHFKNESYTEITGCNTTTRNRKDAYEYDKEVDWINDFMFRMKIGNLTYLFNAK